jgi:hypothetical protein
MVKEQNRKTEPRKSALTVIGVAVAQGLHELPAVQDSLVPTARPLACCTGHRYGCAASWGSRW